DCLEVGVFSAYPVHLFPDEFRGNTASQKDTPCVLDHLRIPTEIACGLKRFKTGGVDVFAQDVFGAAEFTVPLEVLPKAAHGGNVAYPAATPRQRLQLFTIAEFPGTAG